MMRRCLISVWIRDCLNQDFRDERINRIGKETSKSPENSLTLLPIIHRTEELGERGKNF